MSDEIQTVKYNGDILICCLCDNDFIANGYQIVDLHLCYWCGRSPFAKPVDDSILDADLLDC